MKKSILTLSVVIMSTNSAFAQIASGNCSPSNSSGCQWTITDDGVLKITGQGTVGNGICSTATGGSGSCVQTQMEWNKYKADIKSIDISGVSMINYYAFWGLSNVESVKISDSVENIRNRAFADLPNLKSVDIGNGVKTIEDWAFYNASQLTDLKLGNSLETIGTGAFEEASSLKKLEIPDSVKTIENQAFKNASQLEELILGDSVEKIGSYAFENTKISSVVLPSSLQNLSNYQSFKGTPLAEITMSGDVTDENWDKYKSAVWGLVYWSAKAGNRGIRTINCAGFDASVCQEALNLASIPCSNIYNSGCPSIAISYNTAPAIPKKIQEVQNPDGSYSVYYKGQLISTRGKRIYTIEEAERLSKKTGHTFKLRYK